MAGRIFITGDVHGSIDIGKLGSRRFPEGRTLDRDDFVAICGDFGCVWGGPEKDRYWLDWLEGKPFTTLFVDGNHENFDLLDAMEPVAWRGGTVHEVRPHVLHLMRGQVFDLHGRSFFTLGGARSHDKPFRTPRISWWEQELPTMDELEQARAVLEEQKWRVDYVVTHCAPANIQYRVCAAFDNDRLTYFLFDVEQQLDYRHWFFGHYHENLQVGCKQTAVYEDIWEIVLGRTPDEDELRLVCG